MGTGKKKLFAARCLFLVGNSVTAEKFSEVSTSVSLRIPVVSHKSSSTSRAVEIKIGSGITFSGVSAPTSFVISRIGKIVSSAKTQIEEQSTQEEELQRDIGANVRLK